MNRVCLTLNKCASQSHRVTVCFQAWDAQDYWPGVRPPYHSTLSQLGLVNTPGIPSLADNMLHRKAGKLVQGVIRSLLMNPPPHEVAAATRRALRQLGVQYGYSNTCCQQAIGYCFVVGVEPQQDAIHAGCPVKAAGIASMISGLLWQLNQA